MIRLNVFIWLEETNRSKALEAAKELTGLSVKEEGCIAYDIFESATRPQVMMICETWKNAESLSNHEKTEHFVKNIALLSALATMKIEKFEF